jgi:hypothetical protein
MNGLKENRGDEIAGDDEEDVHTHKPTGQEIGKCVIEDNDYNCNSAQTVNIRAIRHMPSLRSGTSCCHT